MSFSSASICSGSRLESSSTMSSIVKFLFFLSDEMDAIQATTVAVIGLYSHGVELVLGSVGDQHVFEAAAIRIWCSSKGVEKFRGVLRWKVERLPVNAISLATVRVDDETVRSVIHFGREVVGTTHGRRQVFEITFQLK